MEKYGWICPRCGKVNAPWVAECGCAPDYRPWWEKFNGKGSSKLYEDFGYTTSTTTSGDSTYSTQSTGTSPL